MRALRNEKGLALISTLMLLVLGFGVVAMLLRLVTAETKLSRLEQSYTAALDSGKAGADMMIFLIQNEMTTPPTTPGIGGTTASPTCFGFKQVNATSGGWYTTSGTPTTAWTAACPGVTPAMATNPDPTISPDVTMTLANNYTVSIKIVDTVTTTPNVNPPPAPCQSGCYFYTVNVRSVAATTNERSDISFVYRFDIN